MAGLCCPETTSVVLDNASSHDSHAAVRDFNRLVDEVANIGKMTSLPRLVLSRDCLDTHQLVHSPDARPTRRTPLPDINAIPGQCLPGTGDSSHPLVSCLFLFPSHSSLTSLIPRQLAGPCYNSVMRSNKRSRRPSANTWPPPCPLLSPSASCYYHPCRRPATAPLRYLPLPSCPPPSVGACAHDATSPGAIPSRYFPTSYARTTERQGK